MKYSLITVIESDGLNIDSAQGFERYFEQEAVKCFKHWRKNAGWLADIPIYTVCVTKNTVSEETKRAFDRLGVVYIEEYFPETEGYDCGFWNKPLGCSFLEKKLLGQTDRLIHIDLDMYLLESLDPSLFEESGCLVYDQRQRLKERQLKADPVREVFNTCFIVSKIEDQLFKNWYLELKNLPLFENKDYYSRYFNLEYRKLEELAFDLVSLKQGVRTIKNLIFGETYTDITEMEGEALSEVKFHHYHIYEMYSRYKWLDEYRRWKNAKGY